MTEQLRHDEKAAASLTLGEVIAQTADNYPDRRFRPNIVLRKGHYTFAGIDTHGYPFWVTADGIGTKPEFSERMFDMTRDPSTFSGRGFDVLSMIESDEARFGRQMVGAATIIDMNSASDLGIIGVLAKDLKDAADEGKFAILNGETAELGYRTSGYGDVRLNWNAVGVSVYNPEKLILGEGLKPGQPVVALREKSIRSNGLTKARAILETDFLLKQGLKTKSEYVLRELTQRGVVLGDKDIDGLLLSIFGHDAMEQVLPPWHQDNPEVTRQLMERSRLYGPAIYLAQGEIDQPRNVDLVAAAHISGGGIPEKAKRMVESKGLGVSIDAPFDDPEAVSSLINIAEAFPEDVKAKIKIDDRVACEQWNRGIGFLVVTGSIGEANKLLNMVEDEGYEAAIAGKIIDQPQIQFRGHTWDY